MRITSLIRSAIPLAALSLLMASCTDRTTIFNNPDPNLRLTASDAQSGAPLLDSTDYAFVIAVAPGP